jgi:hypothetical protein
VVAEGICTEAYLLQFDAEGIVLETRENSFS